MIKTKIALLGIFSGVVTVIIGLVALPFLLMTLLSLYVQQELQNLLTAFQKVYVKKLLEWQYPPEEGKNDN